MESGYYWRTIDERAMKVEISTTVEKAIEVDVNFPIYRAHDLDDLGGSMTYSAVFIESDGSMTERTIGISSGSVEMESVSNYQFDKSNLDYLLGRGLYKSNAKEFEQAVSAACEVLNGIMLATQKCE